MRKLDSALGLPRQPRKNLTKLTASHNLIEVLPDALFADLWNLEHLNVAHNGISEIPQDVEKLKRYRTCCTVALSWYGAHHKMRKDQLMGTYGLSKLKPTVTVHVTTLWASDPIDSERGRKVDRYLVRHGCSVQRHHKQVVTKTYPLNQANERCA